MAEAGDREDRSEQPTQKRLQDARDRGQVPRSRELTGTAVMLATAAVMLATGGQAAAGMQRLVRAGLSIPREALAGDAGMFDALAQGTLQALAAVAPVLAAALLAAVAGPAAMGSVTFSGEGLAPDLTRLNPLTGLGRIFSLNGLSELVKALLKFLVVGVAAGLIVWWLLDDMLLLGAMGPGAGIGAAAHLLALAMLLLSAALALIAAVDVPFQLWSHRRELRMTRLEIKEEYKETEGRTEVKSRIRGLQQQLARRRMLQQVPQADVVVTNPTHYAVALKYEAGRMRAPRVVAKGRDLLALEIRRRAVEAGVPLFEAPPLARALHATVELGRDVPPGLYLAVAQVLSYVLQVRSAGSDAWRLRRPVPQVDAEYLRP
jgi:flagellar biosynthesis protein FlhB